MPIEFICIDDQSADDVDPLVKAVCSNRDDLIILRVKPIELEEQIKFIENKKPNGLILDLRLDQQRNEAGYKAPYHGLTIAQELRTRMTEKRLSPFPIVLWSVDSKFKNSYNRDLTSHDLFERVYVKDTEVARNSFKVAEELVDLVTGYRIIIEQQEPHRGHLQRILGLEEDAEKYWDPRIGEKFLSRFKYPPHEYARFILRELIDRQGPLIDKNVLAARLGIDKARSANWEKCLNLLKGCAYNGAFSGAWPRWWAAKVDNWWNSQNKSPGPLRRLTAEERVKFLKSGFRMDGLEEAMPIDEGYSTKFWTICQGLLAPLDPIDGLRASCAELKSWQDPPFLSVKAALERIGRDRGVMIHPLEHERLAEIKAELRKHGT